MLPALTEHLEDDHLPDGVHYCPTTGVFNVWVGGSVVARSTDLTEAGVIYRNRLLEKRLSGFMPADRWMVDAYGD
jgi:hypothetical protein